MKAHDFKQIARHFLEEVYNQRNPSEAEKLLAHDFVDLMPSGAAFAEGPNPMAGFQRILDASRDVRAEILDLVSDGRWVAIRARYVGTDTGGLFPGLPALGGRFDVEGIDVFTVNADGKFTAHYGILDMRGVMDQLGLVTSASSSPNL